jgi:hypothetical protein
MITTTISPLRQRMVEDMSLRNLAPRTQEAYIRGCKKLAAFLRRSPDTATAEDIRLFQLHLAEQGVSICTRNRTRPEKLQQSAVKTATYSITSSARAKSDGGTVIPRIFAILRLMTIRNRVGCHDELIAVCLQPTRISRPAGTHAPWQGVGAG